MVDNKPNNLVIYDKIILIIEGIDHFIDPLTNQEAIVAFWLPRFFPKRVRIIITGDKASNSYKYFFNGLLMFTLKDNRENSRCRTYKSHNARIAS